MRVSILFVCLGNICRSPAAEGVLRVKAAAAGLDLRLDSCGTGRWHLSEPPYGPMQRAAAARGYPLADLRARALRSHDYRDFDMLLAMDRDNLADILSARPEGGRAQAGLFLNGGQPDEVPDPYYTRDFDGALDLIEAGADRLIAQLAGTGKGVQSPLDW